MDILWVKKEMVGDDTSTDKNTVASLRTYSGYFY